MTRTEMYKALEGRKENESKSHSEKSTESIQKDLLR